MKEDQWGLAGLGRSGDWTVDIDDNLVGEGFALTISHPRFYLQTPTMSKGEIGQLTRSLARRSSGTIGRLLGATLSLEFTDSHLSFRLREGRALLELFLKRSELDELVVALKEACLEAEIEAGG